MHRLRRLAHLRRPNPPWRLPGWRLQLASEKNHEEARNGCQFFASGFPGAGVAAGVFAAGVGPHGLGSACPHIPQRSPCNLSRRDRPHCWARSWCPASSRPSVAKRKNRDGGNISEVAGGSWRYLTFSARGAVAFPPLALLPPGMSSGGEVCMVCRYIWYMGARGRWPPDMASKSGSANSS